MPPTFLCSRIETANSKKPLPIVKIFDYSKHGHGSPIDISTPHSLGDIHSGSIETKAAKIAIHATVELIILGLKAVSRHQRSLFGWEKYKNIWLLENNLPRKMDS